MYAKQWRPQGRKLNTVTPMVVERFLDEMESDRVGLGEFREMPLPRSVREAIERYAEKHGTTHGVGMYEVSVTG
ncbi:hypothetical protein [Streptomyces sp. CB02460]|uniref:hypothetical protein n=1 Tax=Streptomyces sp. CB02460 TaxID=1703941 RepID=UPI00093D506C|nr:hypothetical protein [Streptomyces sp. CB02460]OKJ73193.1 hypothetical protein AMK30_19870 [Streptomyces sp. CB02460]